MRKANSTERAFTLTELIIVVAVIGILAAVIIPAFVNVSDKSLESADKNTVTALNSTLDSGIALDKDLSDIIKVRNYLTAKGFNPNDMIPQSIGENDEDKYCFVWDKNEGVILMVRLLTNEVVLPENYQDTVNDEGWYFLSSETAPSTGAVESDYEFPSARKIARTYFAEKVAAMSAADKAKSYVFIAKVKMEYTYDGVTYPVVENESERVQTVYAVYDGSMEGTSTNPFGPFSIIRTSRGQLYNTTTAVQGWVLQYITVGGTNYETIAGIYDQSYVKDTETSAGSTFYMFTKLADDISVTGNVQQEKTW